jgi:hypothetical protein
VRRSVARLRTASSAPGAAETTSADRLGTIAPGAPAPTAQPNATQAAQAGAAALEPQRPPASSCHITRAIPGVSKAMSPAVQRRVAQYLLDPTMTQQGISAAASARVRKTRTFGALRSQSPPT